MAGILDEVMEGIGGKSALEQKAPTEAPKTEQAASAKTEEDTKSLHGYSDDFKEKYGEKK